MLTIGRRPARVAAMAAGVLLVAGVAACGTRAPGAAPSSIATSPVASQAPQSPSAAAPSAAPSASASTLAPAPPPPPRPSAAGQLAAFFTAAAAADAQLRQTAALVNRNIGPTVIGCPAAEVTAIKALQGYVDAVAKAIPAGLPTELLRRVMLTYSDLESRAAAFHAVTWYVPANGSVQARSDNGREVISGLGRGAPAAARFAGDLASVRDLASATPPVTLAAPGSRVSAEVAVRTALINLANTGCASTGGWVSASLFPLTWQAQEMGNIHADGMVNGVAFSATYQGGGNWRVTLYAC